MKKIRVKKVTITYDLDDVLEYHYTTINGVLDNAGNHLKNEKAVDKWYAEHYPLDDMGGDIRPDLKWDELFERMRCGECVYTIIGVADTVVRERIEDHLCLLLGIPHKVLNEL